MATKKLTEAQLKSAYQEFDDLAHIKPPIVWTSQKQFEKELYETYAELVEPDDEFTKETQEVFDTLKAMFEGEATDTKDEELEKEEPQTDVEDAPEPEPEPEPKPAKKTVKSKKTVTAEKPKAESKPEPKPEPKPKSEPKQEEKPEALTRADNFATIYKEGVPYTRQEWIKKMRDLYPKKMKNDVGAKLHFNVYSKLLIALDKMKVTEDGKFVKA